MASSYSRHLVGDSGSKSWNYKNSDVVTISWQSSGSHDCSINFLLDGKVVDDCKLSLQPGSNSYSFNMGNSQHFAMGYVNFNKTDTHEDLLEFNLHYGERPKTKIGVL